MKYIDKFVLLISCALLSLVKHTQTHTNTPRHAPIQTNTHNILTQHQIQQTHTKLK